MSILFYNGSYYYLCLKYFTHCTMRAFSLSVVSVSRLIFPCKTQDSTTQCGEIKSSRAWQFNGVLQTNKRVSQVPAKPCWDLFSPPGIWEKREKILDIIHLKVSFCTGETKSFHFIENQWVWVISFFFFFGMKGKLAWMFTNWNYV